MAVEKQREASCRDHGGKFYFANRRGRSPVRCTEENPCDMVKRPSRKAAMVTRKTVAGVPNVKVHAPAETRSKRPPKTTLPVESSLRTTQRCSCPEMDGERHVRGIKGCKYATKGAPTVVRHNPSIQFAGKARERLEPLGWNLKGKAGFDEDGIAWAMVTGSRLEETIVLRWENGKLVDQIYSVWNSDASPGMNGRPRSRLPFDPDEMVDSELIRELAGRKVTWWNNQANGTEHAIIGDKLQIQHNFTGGNETARMILFVDKTAGRPAFRAFHVGALMKVV